MSSWRYSGFGLSIESDFPLLPVRVGAVGAPAQPICIRRGSLEAVAALLSTSPEVVWETSFDDLAYRTERGAAGDYRFELTATVFDPQPRPCGSSSSRPALSFSRRGGQRRGVIYV